MKILGIVGSRRKKGNTSILVQDVLKIAANHGIETEIIFLGDYSLSSCTGCEGCKDTYRCVVQDDMQKIYNLMLESDALVLGSPTYHYNVTAEVKTFIDRCYCFEVFAKDDRSCWVGINEALGCKYAVTVAVCEQFEEKYMGFTAEAMAKPLTDMGYRVVDTIKALGLFKAGEASKNTEASKKAQRAGERLVKTLLLKREIKNNFNNNELSE